MYKCTSKTRYVFESYILKYLTRPTNGIGVCKKNYDKYTVIQILKIMYPELIVKLKGKVCPFCGKSFRNFSSLSRHLRKVCYLSLKRIVNEVINVYEDFRKNVKYVTAKSPTSGKRTQALKVKDKVFFKYCEAVKYYLRLELKL